MTKAILIHLMVLLKEKMSETSSVVGGIVSFILLKVPTAYEFELFQWKFLFGFISAIIYAVVGWHVKQYLDNRKRKRGGDD